ncbi:hypothetical protein AK812_SmicGene44939, partial [Symbiodinium microadriaticum]
MFSNLYNPFFYAMKMNKAYAFSFHDLPRMPGTCMILDEMAMPLKRSWCLFELLQTIELERTQANFRGLLFCTEHGVLNFGASTVESGESGRSMSRAESKAPMAPPKAAPKAPPKAPPNAPPKAPTPPPKAAAKAAVTEAPLVFCPSDRQLQQAEVGRIAAEIESGMVKERRQKKRLPPVPVFTEVPRRKRLRPPRRNRVDKDFATLFRKLGTLRVESE